MLVPYWVVVLVIYSSSIVAGDIDLSSNETQLMESWALPPNAHGAQWTDTRGVRHAKFSSVQSPIMTNTISERTVTLKNLDKMMPNVNQSHIQPPYNQPGFRGGNFPGNYGSPPMSGYIPNGGNNGYGANYGPPGYHGAYGYNPGNYGRYNAQDQILLVVNVKESDCEGSLTLKADSLTLAKYDRSKFCNRVFKSLASYGIPTMTTKKATSVSVNKLQELIALVEPRGNKISVFLLFLSIKGSDEGKLIAIKARFSYGELFRFCSDSVFSSNINSEDTTLLITDPTANLVVDCHDNPSSCYDKVKSKKQVECSGKAYIS